MTLEPWIEKDSRRGTHTVRWRDVNGKKCRDTYVYDKRSDAKTRKDKVRDMLVNQSLGRVDLSRSPQECMEKFLEDLEKAGSTRVGTTRCAITKFLNLTNSDGRKVIQSMADITRENILNYKSALQAEKLSQHTIQTYLSGCVRRWLGWCVDHKWLAVLPYFKIEVQTPKKIDRFYTDNELASFESAIDDDEFRCIFRLGYRCGLRPGERLRIRSEHIIWDKLLMKGELYIPPDDAKTDAGGRYTELPTSVYGLLPKREGLLFPDWTEERVKRYYRRAKKKAGIEDRILKDGRVVYKTLYWTRHTYAKRYLERGGSLQILSRRMGHTSIEMTNDVYGRLERSALHDVIVPEISAGQQNPAGQWRGKQGNFDGTDRNQAEPLGPNQEAQSA